MNKEMLKGMFDNLLHIWNKSNYWSPQMKSYIHSSTNGVHVIDLIQTMSKFEEVKAEIEDLTLSGKRILFVATKIQWRDAFQKLAEDTGNYFVTEKWVPGLLTNFKTMKVRISTYLKLIRDSETGAFDVLTKKEKANKMLELEKLDRAFKGLKEMKGLPDVIFAVDAVYEQQALKEAAVLGIHSIAICNTNGNPHTLNNLIPANTNAVKSIEFIVNELKGSFKKADPAMIAKKKKAAAEARAAAQPKKPEAKKTETKTAPKKEAPAKTEAKPLAKAAPKKAAPKAETKAPAKKAAATKDDLTKIEGIGPKIAETLTAAGVATFAELSAQKPTKISEIIADVRGNHTPDTWPKQAKMAADGKWDELKVWQDEMDGGKPTK